MRAITIIKLVLATLLCHGSVGYAQDSDGARDDSALDAMLKPIVGSAMTHGLVPGFQIAVVVDDGRIWTRAFGSADMDSGRPVTDETRFYIASSTKALTALAAAQLASKGLLDLDASLEEAFPDEARFHPDFDPSAVRVRDLLTHTHGLRQGPLSFRIAFTGEVSNETILELLGDHAPLPDRKFRYSNLGYDLIGYLMDQNKSRGWKEVVHREVLRPLGMEHTTAFRSEVQDEHLAFPHEIGARGVRRIRLAKSDDNLGAAGGYFSTASDLARLLMVQLNGGRIDGVQVIPQDVIEETQHPYVQQDRQFIDYQRHAWSLGWDIGTHESRLVYHRPGSFAGYYSNIAFMPELGIGLVVLANGGRVSAPFAEIVAAAVYDQLSGGDGAEKAMHESLDELTKRLQVRVAEISERRIPELLDETPRPLSSYEGTYFHRQFGTIRVEAEEGSLKAVSGMLLTDLLPRATAGDVFFAQFVDDDDQFTFEFEELGAAARLRVRGIPGAFVRTQELDD